MDTQTINIIIASASLIVATIGSIFIPLYIHKQTVGKDQATKKIGEARTEPLTGHEDNQHTSEN